MLLQFNCKRKQHKLLGIVLTTYCSKKLMMLVSSTAVIEEGQWSILASVSPHLIVCLLKYRCTTCRFEVCSNYIFSILVQTKVVAEWSVHGSSSTYELNGCDTQKFPVWRTGIYNKLRLNLLNGLLSLNKHDTLEKTTNVELALPNMRILLKWISEDAEHLRISNFPPHVYMVWYVLSIAFLCNSCNFRYLILG